MISSDIGIGPYNHTHHPDNKHINHSPHFSLCKLFLLSPNYHWFAFFVTTDLDCSREALWHFKLDNVLCIACYFEAPLVSTYFMTLPAQDWPFQSTHNMTTCTFLTQNNQLPWKTLIINNRSTQKATWVSQRWRNKENRIDVHSWNNTSY